MKVCGLLLSFILTALLLQSTSAARTATRAEREACMAKIQPKIDEIDARMRLGYTAEEGERLKARRRKLEEARTKCNEVKS